MRAHTIRLDLIAIAASLAALPAAGCGEADEDPAEHACEHADHAHHEVTASESMDENAPEIVLDGDTYRVTLPAGVPGYVRVEIAEETGALLFVAAEDVVQGLYHEGEEEALPEPAPNEHCPDEIPEHYDLDFHEAGTYHLKLLSAQGGDIWLMLSSAEGHADH